MTGLESDLPIQSPGFSQDRNQSNESAIPLRNISLSLETSVSRGFAIPLLHPLCQHQCFHLLSCWKASWQWQWNMPLQHLEGFPENPLFIHRLTKKFIPGFHRKLTVSGSRRGCQLTHFLKSHTAKFQINLYFRVCIQSNH